MPKKLPKGVRQICFREKTGLFGYSEQISEYGNSSCEDRAGRFCGIRVLQSDSRDAEENLSIEEELTGQAERGVLCLLFCVSAHAELIMVNSPDAMPETDADGFLPAAGDGYYYSNHAEGLWLYMDADTRIEITRHQTKSPLITYYLADIVCRPGTTLYTRTWNEKKPGRTRA